MATPEMINYANRPAHLRDPEAWAAYQEECRQRNEEAKQQLANKREAAKLELERKHEAERVNAADAARAAFEARARAAFPGTDAEFKRALPDLVRQWQVEQVMEAERQGGLTLVRKLASGLYDF